MPDDSKKTSPNNSQLDKQNNINNTNGNNKLSPDQIEGGKNEDKTKTPISSTDGVGSSKPLNGQAANSGNAATAGGSNNNAAASTANTLDLESYVRDWRHFECQTWHLEPTVRLLSWAGKSIEPYGIDYILNKLGFSHARTTIPKWLQRGFMDPLDKVQALMMLQLLIMIRENKVENGNNSPNAATGNGVDAAKSSKNKTTPK